MNDDKEKKELLEPFEIALRLEKEGQALFLKAAAETKSKIAKQTFEFLAKEEDKHIEKIEEFYHSIESSSETLPDVDLTKTDEKLESFNLKLEQIKDEFKPTMSDIEAYQLALKFENGAEEFYAKKFHETDDPGIKKFYQWLIVEESMHSRLINSCLKFVEDPVEWFKKRNKA